MIASYIKCTGGCGIRVREQEETQSRRKPVVYIYTVHVLK